MTTTTDTPSSSPPPPPAKRSAGKRIVKILVLLVLGIILLGLLAVYLALDQIVKTTVVSQSSAQLNVPTNLDGAHVSLFGGKVSLKKFDVGSPQGFKSPQLMQLGGLDVGVKVSELREKPLHINEITITDPKMVIEMAGTQFNIKKFVDSLPAGDAKPAEASEPMKLIINELKVSGATVIFRPDVQAISAMPGIGSSLSGMKSEYVLTIPPLDLKDIGTGEGNQNGAAIKDIVTLLVTQLASKATESDQLPPELRQLLHLNVNDIVNTAKAKLGEAMNKQLGKITEDLSKKLPPEAGKALGDVLKNSTGDSKQDAAKSVEQQLGGFLHDKKEKKPAANPAAPATQPK
jgi:hypothetical protein